MENDPSPWKRRKANAGEKLVTSVADFSPMDQVHKDKAQRNRRLKHRAPLPALPYQSTTPRKDDARQRNKSACQLGHH
jgi:hypothetical protein